MNTQVAVLAAVTVLLHVTAARGFSVKSQDSEHQLDAGDGTGMEQVLEESDASNQDLDAGDLMLVRESVGNDLHDIRRREARSKKRSGRRQGEAGDGSGMDQNQEPEEKVVMKGISDFLEPQKEKIINFMKPILDRIKHKPKRPGLGDSSDSSASPSTPAPSPTPSESDTSSSSDPDASSSFDSGASNSSDSGASNSTNSDASKPSDSSANLFPLFPASFSKCGENERDRSMSTLSLLFPDKDEQPFVFVPLTNTLMRVVEQQIMRESQSGGDSRRKLHN